jgi:hypothetical protein
MGFLKKGPQKRAKIGPQLHTIDDSATADLPLSPCITHKCHCTSFRQTHQRAPPFCTQNRAPHAAAASPRDLRCCSGSSQDTQCCTARRMGISDWVQPVTECCWNVKSTTSGRASRALPGHAAGSKRTALTRTSITGLQVGCSYPRATIAEIMRGAPTVRPIPRCSMAYTRSWTRPCCTYRNG